VGAIKTQIRTGILLRNNEVTDTSRDKAEAKLKDDFEWQAEKFVFKIAILKLQ
jgi:hypothetical protein